MNKTMDFFFIKYMNGWSAVKESVIGIDIIMNRMPKNQKYVWLVCEEWPQRNETFFESILHAQHL